MKQCVSQCSLSRVTHDCRHTARIRQGGVYISREGRAYSPQIIICRALQQEVLQISSNALSSGPQHDRCARMAPMKVGMLLALARISSF
jgi:hypothetical protein